MNNKKFISITIILAVLLLLGGCNQPFSMFVNNSAFLTFDLTADNNGLSADVEGSIVGNSILLPVPAGTGLASLVPSFTFLGREVRVGTEVQISGETARNFSSPVTYTVVAWSGAETEYTVSAVAETGGGAIIPTASWAKTLSSVPGAGEAVFKDAAVDGDGNVYAVGYQDEQDAGMGGFGYDDGVMADGQNGNINSLIVKYSPEGTTLWARTVESSLDNCYFNAVAVDSAGNAYAAGYQNGTGKYTYGDGVSATGACSGSNVSLVKYGPDGTVQWARTAAGAGVTDCAYNDVTLDSSGNIYTVGYQEGGVSYEYGGSASVAGESSNTNAVVVKYDASGSGLWASSTFVGTASNSDSDFQAVTVSSGTVYTAGIQYVPVGGPTDFNYSLTIYVSGVGNCNNGVLVAYDGSSGEAQWARAVNHAATTGSSNYYGIAVSGTDIYTSGDIYFDSGYNTDNFDFGNLQSVDGLDETVTHAVLVKYDSAGDAQWVSYPTATPGNCSFNGVAIDSDGTIHAAGYQSGLGTYDYGTGITATGGSEFGNNALKVVYDSTGTAASARSAAVAASGDSKFYAAAADGAGNVYAAGYLFGTDEYTFADGVSATGANGTGGPNVVVVKYGP